MEMCVCVCVGVGGLVGVGGGRMKAGTCWLLHSLSCSRDPSLGWL